MMLQLNSINTNGLNQNNKHNYGNVSFGKILPKHLFIKLDGFKQNKAWADEMIKCIEDNVPEVQNKTPFGFFLNDISQRYAAFFQELSKNSISGFMENGLFGKMRTFEEGDTIVTDIGKYSSYIDKIKKFVGQKGKEATENLLGENFQVKEYKFMLDGEKLLARVVLVTEKLSESFKKATELDIKDLINIEYAPSGNVYPTLKKIQDIYEKIVGNGKVKTEKELEILNKNIAKVHWLFAQSTPFCRGSAGIADVFTKTLYEAMGVQVAPWKKGIAPDLEAYVRPLDEYVNNYTKLFEKPPEIMEKVK